MAEKTNFIEKAKGAINKLPFNNLAGKVPALAKVAGYANYAFCALAVVLLVAIFMPGKTSLVGTWIHEYDGSSGGRVIIDRKTNSLAEQISIFSKDGSYYMKYALTKDTDTVYLDDGTFAFYATGWREYKGTWSLNEGALVIDFGNGKTSTYKEGDFEFDKKTLRLYTTLYYKK